MTALVVAAGLVQPADGLALDEAIARVAPEAPVVAVWRSSPAVVVGRFQRVDWEVDAAACGARGVRAWRRFTGGGAVYLDPGVVCAALAVPATHPDAALGIPEMYAPFLDGMARACRALGVDAVADERTVRVDGLKVTGIAAHRGRAATLVHGTLLVDADLDALRACLAGPRGGDLGGAPRPAMSRPDHVANVGGTVQAAEQAIIAALAPDGSARPLDPERAAAAARLVQERYACRTWHAAAWLQVMPADAVAVLGGG
ncbi:MAG: lipoate--protein ligase family protein [Gaiellales bacterium]